MDKFIVSARKYRPQTFDTVVGQSHITTTLKNAIRNNQLAHAFLFCGPRGVGKTTCARILAKTINCENRTADAEACNACSSCVSFNEGASMNYFELDAASNNSVDNIRDLVDQIRYVPQSGQYKVYVIDEVHMLSSAAFNAFLKTLEEPPPYAIFILATTEKHKIIPTILSRCQIFDFKRITTQDTVAHLEEICRKESIRAERAALQLIAQKSEGCMRDALSILDKIVSFTNGELSYANTLEHLNILDEDYFFRLLDCMQAQDLSSALLLYDEINRKGFEGDQLLNGFAEFIRNLLVSHDEKAAVLLDVVESFRDRYIAKAKEVASALLVSTLNILNEAETGYRAARNRRLHVELALIRLCYLQQALELVAEGDSVAKKKMTARPKFISSRPLPGYQAVPSTKTKEARLFVPIEEKKEKKPEAAPSVMSVSEPPVAGRRRIEALQAIRKKVQENGHSAGNIPNEALDTAALTDAWNNYVAQLRAAKHTAAASFERARLVVRDNNSFEVITGNNIEQKFIEQQRNQVYQFLHRQLRNHQLQFSVVVSPQDRKEQPAEVHLTFSQQYQKMVEQFPLVKDLKERLGLDLDY